MRQGVLTADECRCFKGPQFAILGEHRQVLLSDGAILAVVGNADMQALAPRGSVMYVKF
jgi:hypothetical protein